MGPQSPELPAQTEVPPGQWVKPFPNWDDLPYGNDPRTTAGRDRYKSLLKVALFSSPGIGEWEVELTWDADNSYDESHFGSSPCLVLLPGGVERTTVARLSAFEKRIETRLMSLWVSSNYSYKMLSQNAPPYQATIKTGLGEEFSAVFETPMIHEWQSGTGLRGHFSIPDTARLIENLEIKVEKVR